MYRIMTFIALLVLSAGINAHPLHKNVDPELKCLADTIYHEARAEPVRCREMVAEVVLNRTRHPSFPNTICRVVYQRGQFAWTPHNPSIKEPGLWIEAMHIARQQMRHQTSHAGKSIFFTQGRRFGPVVTRCGAHIFMRDRRNIEF